MSNSNRGPGYLTGHIQSTRAGAFILQDIEILTLPGSERLLLQASIGTHDLELSLLLSILLNCKNHK